MVESRAGSARAGSARRGRTALSRVVPLALLTATATAAGLLTPAPPARALDDRSAPSGAGPVQVGSSYAIASESAYASAAAEAVLRKPRATAVDALVAAVLDIGVTKPEACGLGGGGFLVRRGPDGDVTTLDFREVAPSVPYGPDDTWRPYLELGGARTNPGTGHAVVGVPGTLAGLVEMHKRWGKVPWRELFDAAIDHARNGFRAGRDLAWSSGYRRQDMLAFQDTLQVFGGVAEGALVVQEDLAATLERLRDAPDPFDEFYVSGQTADNINYEMLEGVTRRQTVDYGDYSKWARGDLSSYRVRSREPVVTRFGEYEIYGMGAPSSGGIAVGQILGMLAGDSPPEGVLTDVPVRARWVHLLAEVERLAFADRAVWVGDPQATEVPTQAMLDPAYLDERRALVDDDGPVLNLEPYGGTYPAGQFDGYVQPPSADSPSVGSNTTHISIVTAAGEAVSLTCTIEQALGSAVTAWKTGILLNNELTDFNAPGMNPNAANAYRPGRRPRSSMSPTIVVRDGKPVLAIGAQGGERIISGVAQTLLAVLRDGNDVPQALAAGRVRGHLPHPDIGPRAVDVEQVPVLQDYALKETLKGFGHSPVNFRAANFESPVLSAVQVDAATGRLTAASDPRGEIGSRAG